jgi:type II secretory pathway component PulF
MQLYSYRAARADGVIVRGLVEAQDGGAASATLFQRGLHPLRVDPAGETEGHRRPASRRELGMVFRSIAALFAAGVPLERAVAASQAVARGALRESLAEASVHLRAGRSFTQALEAARGVVPPLVTSMLRVGERGSQLGRALDQVASQLEQEADLMKQVRQALAYPALLLTAGVGSILFIGIFVIPKFASMLDDVGGQLPLTTKLLLGGSSFMIHHAIVLGITVTGLVLGLSNYVRTPPGGTLWDRLLLKVPAVGPVRHALASARISRALGGMLQVGMPMLSALNAAHEAAGDRILAGRVMRARQRVAEGQALAPALECERALSASVLQLVAVGEASGQLAAMSARAGDLAAQEAQLGLRTLVSLLEPALVVIFGGMVAFVAAALLQAVYSIRPGV